MLVYANSFTFEPPGGVDQIVGLVAKWIGKVAKQRIDELRLAEGIRELRLNNGGILISRAAITDEKKRIYPYAFCAQLSHRDQAVSGRKWITEVGLRQEGADTPIECSLLLKTDEVSARVTEPIQVTRPTLVEQLIKKCLPTGQTPGLTTKHLDEDSAEAFLQSLERVGREHPVVLISCNKEGAYPVEPERLRSLLVGLSDVIEVPAAADTFAIQEVVGRQYIAFGGAIKVIFPPRKDSQNSVCDTILLSPSTIDGLVKKGKKVESEVLAAVTHRTNLPYSWRHTSLEMVSQVIFREELLSARERAKTSAHADELQEYIALLDEADKELSAQDKEQAGLRAELEAKEEEIRTLRSKNAGLKHALGGSRDADNEQDNEVIEGLEPLRSSIDMLVRGSPSLPQMLHLAAALYPDRIVVLDTAMNAAEESERGGFSAGKKALELLLKLANEYWQALADGKGDQQAKDAFGYKVYAQNEGTGLSKEAEIRRTFQYRGRDFLMKKHLKIGAKDSVAETLRIHFEWVADEKKLVIGHCGKHLNF